MKTFIPQFSPQIRQKDMDAVQEQMLSGWVGPTQTTLKFENEIKLITGAKHCISTTSGTTAIILALKSLGLPTNSHILFPAYTFLAGANACRFLGHHIKLIDICSITLCMRPALVENAIEQDDIDCVMFVNHNAYVGKDVQIIKKMCDQRNIPMLEDSSQALGMPNAGRTGKVGVFSFSVPKLITTGQGGAIITDDDQIASNCEAWRDHGEGWKKTKIHKYLGCNFKFNDILAAYGLSQLQDIDELLVQRKKIFDQYRIHLDILDHGYNSTWMVLYRSNYLAANKIIDILGKEGIQAAQYYRPINHNPPYADKVNYPTAEFSYQEIVYLPSSLNLTLEQIDRICHIIIRIEREAS